MLRAQHRTRGQRVQGAAACLELAAIGNHDRRGRLAALAADGLDGLDNVHTFGDGAEDNVLAVKPVGLDSAQEKLAAVGARACVGHREGARAGVLQLEVLISELSAVDGFATCAVASGEIASLAHELGDDTVERGALEVERLAALPRSLLAGAQSTEVLQ